MAGVVGVRAWSGLLLATASVPFAIAAVVTDECPGSPDHEIAVLGEGTGGSTVRLWIPDAPGD